MNVDTLIRGAGVLTPEGLRPLDVALAGGRIAALLPRGEGASAAEVIEAPGQWLLPGAIDIHFHIRAPAFPERGTVESETRAAAAGGITTLFEMPITKPCCNSAAELARRRAHFAAHAVVDFGLYVAPGLLDDAGLRAVRAGGAIAFKIFATPTPAGREDEFAGLALPDEADQLAALHRAARADLPIVVHCESAQILAAAHLEARPAMAEAVAVAKLLTMNLQARARLHIAHVTSRETLAVLRAFRGTSDFSAETCPHYLLRTGEDVARVGVFAKINPPVRGAADREALWQALADGTLTHVATDHASFSLAEKLAANGDFLAAPPGTPGSEVLVPMLLDAVAAGRLPLERAWALVSTNPARRFALPDKGRIALGATADLVLVDPAAPTVIRQRELVTFARDVAQLYDGARFRGRVVRTLLAGRCVFDGAVTGRPGQGTCVTPAPAATRAA